jgi:hypothetical protein
MVDFGGIADLVTAGGTLLNLFTKRKQSKEVPAVNEMLGAVRGGQEYAQAASNPNHPYFKNLVALNAEHNLTNLSEGLRELMVQHRRSVARGNPGVLINPERRDEAVASAFMRGLYNQNEDAKQKARDYLLATSQGLLNSAQGYAQPAQYQKAYADLDANRQAAMGGSLADLIRFGGGLYNKWNMPETMQGPASFGGVPVQSSRMAINAPSYRRYG